MRSVDIVIPAYNEAKGIGDVLETLTEYLRAHHLVARIIVVDDGSKDGTGEVRGGTWYFFNTLPAGLAVGTWSVDFSINGVPLAHDTFGLGGKAVVGSFGFGPTAPLDAEVADVGPD